MQEIPWLLSDHLLQFCYQIITVPIVIIVLWDYLLIPLGKSLLLSWWIGLWIFFYAIAILNFFSLSMQLSFSISNICHLWILHTWYKCMNYLNMCYTCAWRDTHVHVNSVTIMNTDMHECLHLCAHHVHGSVLDHFRPVRSKNPSWHKPTKLSVELLKLFMFFAVVVIIHNLFIYMLLQMSAVQPCTILPWRLQRCVLEDISQCGVPIPGHLAFSMHWN